MQLEAPSVWDGLGSLPAQAAVATADPAKWLAEEAWRISSPAQFVAALATQLNALGVPLASLHTHIRYLDPEIIGVSYFWKQEEPDVHEMPIPPEMRERPQYLNSPMAPIMEGEQRSFRVNLSGPAIEGEWSILTDLRRDGRSGYLIFAVPFSDGTISSLSMATSRPGGFADVDVAAIEALLPLIGRTLELHALRRLSTMLLDAYVGRRSGARIMAGRIRLGDVEAIDAVLWFSDLRGSTALAARLDPQDYVVALNAYFAATAGAVLEAGGEVLKFIGDAVMAAFPIEREDCASAVAAKGLEAAHAAVKGVAGFTPAAGGSALACGVGLHRGTVLYGNVGVPQRLDFTVTGKAANVVTRIEGLCRDLGEPILVSPDLAALLPKKFSSVGSHGLNGIRGPVEIYRPLL